MPTKLRRTQITHVPRVQRLLDFGKDYYAPDTSPADILIGLAEERMDEVASDSPSSPDQPKKRNGLTLLPPGKGVLTDEMVEDILNEYY